MDHNQMVDACKDLLSELTDSTEGNQETYVKYANLYDDIMAHTGHRLPENLSQFCLSQMSKNDEDSLILDVGTGTGLVGLALRNAGFKGIIDGIDGSKNMVEACQAKQVFRNVKLEMLSEDQPLPYPSNSYDAIICVGALSLGHIPHGCLKDMLHILKPDGILVFNVAKLPNDPNNKVLESVEHTMRQLVNEGRCSLMKKVDDADVGTCQEELTVENCTYFCYKKV